MEPTPSSNQTIKEEIAFLVNQQRAELARERQDRGDESNLPVGVATFPHPITPHEGDASSVRRRRPRRSQSFSVLHPDTPFLPNLDSFRQSKMTRNVIPLSPRGRKSSRRRPPPLPVQNSTHMLLMDDLGSFTVDDSHWEWFPCTAKEFEWERDWSSSDVVDTRYEIPNTEVASSRNHLEEFKVVRGQSLPDTIYSKKNIPNTKGAGTRDDLFLAEAVHTSNHESNLDVNDTRITAPNADFPFTANDVLLGRGGFTNLHAGNKRFRALAAQLRLAYKATRSNEMKRQISLRLIPMVQSNGARFMKKNSSGIYMEVDVDDVNVMNKLMQAIREDPATGRERRDRSRDEKRRLRSCL